MKKVILVLIICLSSFVLNGQDLNYAWVWEDTKPSKGEWGVVTQEEYEEIAAEFEAFMKSWEKGKSLKDSTSVWDIRPLPFQKPFRTEPYIIKNWGRYNIDYFSWKL